MLESIKKVLRVDNTHSLVPHMDDRVLILINFDKNLPKFIANVDEEPMVYIVEYLGGINTCFICRREGHFQRNFSILMKHKPHIKIIGTLVGGLPKKYARDLAPYKSNFVRRYFSRCTRASYTASQFFQVGSEGCDYYSTH